MWARSPSRECDECGLQWACRRDAGHPVDVTLDILPASPLLSPELKKGLSTSSPAIGQRGVVVCVIVVETGL